MELIRRTLHKFLDNYEVLSKRGTFLFCFSGLWRARKSPLHHESKCNTGVLYGFTHELFTTTGLLKKVFLHSRTWILRSNRRKFFTRTIDVLRHTNNTQDLNNITRKGEVGETEDGKERSVTGPLDEKGILLYHPFLV